MLEFTGFTRWTNIRFVYWSVKSGSLESLKEGRTSTDIAPLLVKLHPFPLICCADVTISLVHRENLSVSVPQMCSVFRCCCFMSVFKKVLINRQATGHYKKLLFMLQVVACHQFDGEVAFDQEPPESREGTQVKKNADWVAKKATWLFRRMT